PVRVRCLTCYLPLLVFNFNTSTAHATEALRFEVTFAESISNQPFTGRVFVYLSAGTLREPRFGPNWLKPEPFFARDVKDWRPGTPITIDTTALGFPMKLAQLPPGLYTAQAVMDFDRGYREIGNGPGNAYSKPVRFEVTTNGANAVALSIDQVVPERQFKETD